MPESTTYLNEAHDLVSPEEAFYVVETETNDDGEIVNELWSVVTSIDSQLTKAGQLIEIFEDDTDTVSAHEDDSTGLKSAPANNSKTSIISIIIRLLKSLIRYFTSSKT